MSSDRRTILTLSALGVLLLAVSGAAVWIMSSSREAAIQRAEAMTTARLEALQAGLEAAAEYVNTEHDEEASVILEKLAEEFPDEALVWQQLSEVRLHQGRDAEAYGMIQTVIDLGQDSRDLRFNAGVVAMRLGTIDEAIMHLQQACRLAPTDIQAPLYLANVYRKVNENAKAQAQLLHIIDIDKTEHHAWGGLAQIAFVENKLDLAEQHLAKARELAPQFSTWQVLQAKILRRRGKPEAAITLLSALGPATRYQQEVVDEVAQCWALMGLPLKAAREHVDNLNRNPEALASAISASRYFLMAGERDEAHSWLVFAQQLDADAPEVQGLARQFEESTAEVPADEP
jgi:predicted Zn-dependent protease